LPINASVECTIIDIYLIAEPSHKTRITDTVEGKLSRYTSAISTAAHACTLINFLQLLTVSSGVARITDAEECIDTIHTHSMFATNVWQAIVNIDLTQSSGEPTTALAAKGVNSIYAHSISTARHSNTVVLNVNSGTINRLLT
jgi:hypothetical protein